jgi:hypothetical protein
LPRIDRTHTWVVTSVYPDFFELMLHWLPKRPYPIIKHMIVITNHDRPDLKEELEAIARKSRPQWPISVVLNQPLWDLSKSYPEPLQDYMKVLGFKIMIPLWIPPPFFFTDDDVFTINDPSSLLAEMTLWGSHNGLDSYAPKGMDLEEVRAWASVINDQSLTVDVFNKTRTDAGVWHFPEIDRDDYHKVLYKFFNTPEAHRAAERGGHRFRMFDQRFLSTWLYRHGGDVYGAPIARTWATKVLPKSVPAEGYFIHYGASSHKPKYVEWLHREADKRGYEQ